MTDDDLRSLLHDAVSDVHPEPALDEIRRRTHQDTGVRRLRPVLAVTLAAATVAAIVGGITLLNRPADPSGGPAVSGPPAGGSPTAEPTRDPGGYQVRALGIYFLGDTPQGPRLYREFHSVRVPVAPIAPVMSAVRLALLQPTDPDYRSPWPDGTDVTEYHESDPVTISLSNDSADLSVRPDGMSQEEAEAAVQQLVYTAQAALQNRTPVRFELHGQDARTLLGVDVSGSVNAQPQLDVLALVSITEPEEGVVVRTSFTAHGVASSFEATVPWEIRKGATVVKRGFSTADGWTDKLYPWQTDPISVADLAEGTYTFVASTDDPSDGEGAGPTTDTRTIVVRR